MAVKMRNAKKQTAKDLIKNSVKIKCCYCSEKETCIRRENKEKCEKRGITTYCMLTPNRPKSHSKKNKSSKKVR